MKFFRLLLVFLVLTAAARAYYDVAVTGSTSGAVWGTDIYTSGSDVGTAAVHAGLIAAGQTTTIRVYLTAREMQFVGSTRNGVTSQNAGISSGSGMILSLVPAAGPQPPAVLLNVPATVIAGQSLWVTANAIDPNGDLNNIALNWSGTGIVNSHTATGDFYALDTSLMAPLSPGTFQLRGEVSDNVGNFRTSAWYTVTVVSPSTNLAPTVWITGPTTLVAGQYGTWAYEAVDANANLSYWKVSLGSTILTQANISGGDQTSSYPYTFATGGTYALTVYAQDTNGLSTTVTLNITVLSPPGNYIDYGHLGGVSCYPDNSSMHPYARPGLAYSYSFLNDGSDSNDHGYGSVGGPNWLLADFGSAKKVLRLYTGGGHITGWGTGAGTTNGTVLQYSSDNTNWTTAYTYATGFAIGGTSIDVGSTGVGITARYWRIYRSNWMATTEFRFEGDPTPYILTVQNGAGTATGVYAGTPRPILADSPPGSNYLFDHWRLISGVGSISDSNSASTNFIMGTGDAVVSAFYVLNVAPIASIAAIPGQTTLLVGQQGTWTCTADDSNKNLSTWSVSLLPITATPETISGGHQSRQFNYTFPTAGTYTLHLEVVDTFGLTTSSDVTVQVLGPPTITAQPQSQTVSAGSTATFSVVATGTPTPTYVWRKDGTNIAGATSSSYAITNAQGSHAGSYSVVVTNVAGSVTSTAATLTVNAPGIPAITSQPQGGTVTAGGTTTLTVAAVGSPTPTCQWRKNGIDLSDGEHIAGATSATLSIVNLDASDTGSYVVVVSNSLGSVTSSTAGLIVQNPSVAGDGGSLPPGWPNQVGSGPSNPAGTGTYAVGMTAGQLSVDKSGALTYSIPLWTVPGTAGMQPQLALNYSSQAGSGIAGFGWSLGGVSAITRGPKTKAVDGSVHGVDFTSADRFYLDGQRLVAVSGTYGADATEYRTEIDSMSKIVSYGTVGTGPSNFKVWTKAGLIIEFGNTTNSAAEATGRSEIVTWAVNKISDTAGNYMTFSYYEDKNNGEQRLTRIDYTGNATVVPVLSTYASTRFTYESRADSFSGYISGSKVSRTQRLKTIECYYWDAANVGGEELVRKYTLDYLNRDLAADDGAGRSILTAVHEADGSGNEYPPLAFDYESTTGGVTTTTTAWNPPGFLGKYNDKPRGSGFVDLNGDGRPDFVQYHVDTNGDVVSSEYGAWLNTVSGWTPAGTAFYPPLPLAKDEVSDNGVRLVDVNGDGIADMFGPDGQIFINAGTGFAADIGWDIAIPQSYPLGAWATYAKPTFVDLNSDGRVDLIATVTYHWSDPNLLTVGNSKTGTPGSGDVAKAGDGATTDAAAQQTETVNAAWLNTGSGWTLTPSYYPLINMSRGSRFVDVNGDGLPDQVQHWRDQGTVEKNVALNTGAGWTLLGSSSVYVPPEMLNQNSGGTDGASVGTELVDLNGDGLVDLIHRNDATGNAYGNTAWLNTGAGWVAAPNGYLSLHELTNDATPQGVAILDLNSDGLPDLVQAWGTSGRDVRLGTGSGWSASAPAFAVTRQISQTGRPSTGTDFIDLDGDGAVDQIWAWSDGAGSSSGATFNNAKPADRLKTVTNGFGVNASVIYAPLTERDASGNLTVYDKGTGGPAGSVNVTGPMYVVKTVRNDDGTGTTHDVNYRYGGLRSDFLRGSLGFEWVQTMDARTGIVSKTTSSQVFPFIGMPVSSETKTAGGTTLSSSSITLAEVAGMNTGIHLPYASQTVESSYDLDGSLIATTTTSTTDIDTYGNVKGMTVSTNGGFSKTTTSTYATADTADWVLGRLTRSTVTAAATGKTSLTRTSSFAYHPTTHLLIKEVVEPDDTAMLKLTTDYQYDDFGNKKIATVTGKDVNAAGQTVTTSRVTTTIYDAKGRFPDYSVNALNHEEDYIYDQKLGVMTSLTGPNSLATTWLYDTFGNKTHEARADSTVSDVAINWAGSGAPSGAKYFVETTASGAAPALVFFDAFGRKIKAVGLDGNGQMIHQDTAYDSMGRAYAVSLPYRPGATIYRTQTTLYDALNRPRTVQTPDDQNGVVTTSFNYAGLTTEVTDGKLRVARTVKNSQGWVMTSVRDVDGKAATVDYDYDAVGNPTTITASGSATILEYDARGRKLAMKDPDMGGATHPWSYGYNAFGELVTQTDATSQTTRMTYDGLGRLVQRVEAEGTTTWTYDTATKGVGKPATVSAPGSYSESYTYNGYSQPEAVTRTIDGTAYTISQFYDTSSRPLRTVYPNGFQVMNIYNAFGFVKEVRRTDGTNASLDLYWHADTYAVDGRVNGETLGNGVTGDRVYSPATGRLLGAGVGLGTSNTVQFLTYLYDQVGNVTSRNDGPTGRSETFVYDTLDRLTSHALAGGAAVTVSYDDNGNIENKSDAGTYSYGGTTGGPHAVTGVTGGPLGAQTYSYDLNGNMRTGGGRIITPTSFNQARVISNGSGHSSTFTFGAAHERVKQVAVNGSITNTTIYIGGIFELVTSSGGTEEKNYVMTPAGRVAVYTAGTYALPNVRYFHTDGLGSITAVSDESGNVVKRFAYDAWGKRTDPATGAVTTSATNGHFTRGFTDHEALDDLGLIHMNGRVYDPVLGRFLSADPNVDGVYDSQGYNRYSYVGNNPMNRTDPSGYFSLKEVLPAIIAVVVTAVVLVALGPGGMLAAKGFFGTLGHMLLHGGWINAAIAGGAGGFASGFSGSLLNGGSLGDAFRSGLIGGITGAVSAAAAYGVGQFFDINVANEVLDWGGRALAHGAVQGGITEASGGEFRHGFYAAAFSSAASPALGKLFPKADQVAQRTIAAAIIGGTASAIGGGKFANGAVTGAFTHLFNAEAENLRSKYWKFAVVPSGTERAEFDKAEAMFSELIGKRTAQNGKLTEVAKIIDEIQSGSSMLVDIVPSRYAAGDDTRVLGGRIVITFNPNVADAIATLAHELWHVKIFGLGFQMPGIKLGDTWHAEAFRVQNQIAYEYGLPLQFTMRASQKIEGATRYIDYKK